MAVPDRPARQERSGRRHHRRLPRQVRHRGHLAAARRGGQQRPGAEGNRRHLECPGRQPIRLQGSLIPVSFGGTRQRAAHGPGMRGSLLLLAFLAGTLVALDAPHAAEEKGEEEKPPSAAEGKGEEEKPKSPWTNSTELSLVVTRGNAIAQTVGFKETLEYKTKKGNTRFKLDTLRADTSDDPYLLVEPGIVFEPGEVPTGFSTIAVYPGTEPDVERYFVEGRYEGNLPKKATW